MPFGRILGLLLTLVVVAAGGSALAGAGETGRDARSGDQPRHRFADRLAAELGLPATQVREALKAVRQERRAERRGTRAERRKLRAERRSKRAARREKRAQRHDRAGRRAHRGERRQRRGARRSIRALRRVRRMRERFAADLAAELKLEPAKVTAALRSLLVERLDRAVARGRLTADGRAALLACFDDQSKCQGLRARLRHP